MASILTNMGAISALQTLRSISAQKTDIQQQVSSGFRVGTASDNAAYWSIATTMRSDNGAMSAVSDALGLGAAKVDVAYTGMEAVTDVLSEFQARLVAAKEPGVDKAKVQEELEQYKQQVVSISQSASFNGQNWLNTNISDIYDERVNKDSVVSSFSRDGIGNVAVQRMEVPLSKTALFNSTGGGLLEADPRSPKLIGGLRFERWSDKSISDYTSGSGRGSHPPSYVFDFTGPMIFDAGDEITFNISVDADNPDDEIDAPFFSGQQTPIVINRATVDAALSPAANGIIADFTEYRRVLDTALAGSGARANLTSHYEPPGQSVTWVITPDKVAISHAGFSSLDGSSMQITDLAYTGVTLTNEIGDRAVSWGNRNSSLILEFEPFKLYGGVEINMDFALWDEPETRLTFDKVTVDSILGGGGGAVSTSAEMATLLAALIDRPEIIVESTSTGTVVIKTDPSIDRKSGEKSKIGIYDIDVNIEPIATMNFLDIDIEKNPDMVDAYVSYLDLATQNVISGAATLGSIQSRIDMQSDFASKLMDTIDQGVGRLVDAEMNGASTRLKALQTQEQLAIQSLSIANSNSENILSLFR